MGLCIYRCLYCIKHFKLIQLNYGAERCQYRLWVLTRRDYRYLIMCLAFTLLSLHSLTGSVLGPETKAAVD